MEYQTFKTLASKWAAEKIIPAIAPEGIVRWAFAFVGMSKIQGMIDEYAPQFLATTPDGKVDIKALEYSLNNAFTAQPVLTLTLPQLPQLTALGMGETIIRLKKEDADSLLTYLRGCSSTTEVAL